MRFKTDYHADCKCAVATIMGKVNPMTREYALNKLARRALTRMTQAAKEGRFDLANRELMFVEFLNGQIANPLIIDKDQDVIEPLHVDENEFDTTTSDLWRAIGPVEQTICYRNRKKQDLS